MTNAEPRPGDPDYYDDRDYRADRWQRWRDGMDRLRRDYDAGLFNDEPACCHSCPSNDLGEGCMVDAS